MLDLQSEQLSSDTLPIQKVGIKKLKLPIQVMLAPEITQATIATFDIAIDLLSTQRATHMSRFIEILHQQDWLLSIPRLQELLNLINHKLASNMVYITADFTIFKNKLAPVTKIASLLEYELSITAIYQNSPNEQYKYFFTLRVPTSCVCPCSKAISDFGAHNQRAMIIAKIEVLPDHYPELNLLNLISTIEQQGSCELYSVLKRPDEKFVTELGYTNAKFVEDIVRDVAKQLKLLDYIGSYHISVESLESIHHHSAYAEIDSI